MTTTTTEPRTDVITTAHKRALRHADSITFRLHEGQATIEANLDARKSPTGFDQKIVINCGGSRVNDYSPKTRHYPDAHVYTGFHLATSSHYDHFMQTLVRRIRTGGFINLLWTRDNNHDLIRAADLHFDMLDVVVSGPEKDGRLPVADWYRVRSSCTLDNSARMVQRS